MLAAQPRAMANVAPVHTLFMRIPPRSPAWALCNRNATRAMPDRNAPLIDTDQGESRPCCRCCPGSELGQKALKRWAVSHVPRRCLHVHRCATELGRRCTSRLSAPLTLEFVRFMDPQPDPALQALRLA